MPLSRSLQFLSTDDNRLSASGPLKRSRVMGHDSASSPVQPENPRISSARLRPSRTMMLLSGHFSLCGIAHSGHRSRLSLLEAHGLLETQRSGGATGCAGGTRCIPPSRPTDAKQR